MSIQPCHIGDTLSPPTFGVTLPRDFPGFMLPRAHIHLDSDWLGHLFCRDTHHNNYQYQLQCNVGSMVFIESLTTEKKEASL